MERYYIESIVYETALEIKKLIDKGMITKENKIVLYGLDTEAFAMRTILENYGFGVDSYISDNPAQVIKYKRSVKAVRARYLNSSRDLIKICSVEERLKPFDEKAVILSASRDCNQAKIEELNYQRNVNFFQVFDWEQDKFAEFVHGRHAMTLKEMQNVVKDMLFIFDRFCIDKGLRYWVCGGTLLGAIRHQGFIPWDDDVDVFMPWEDYRRFMDDAVCDAGHSLIAPHKTDRKKYYDIFSKMADNRTIVREDGGYIRKIHPVAIDIFPLIGLPANKDERHLFFTEYQELERTIKEDFYAHNGDLGIYNRWYLSQEEFLRKYDFDKSDYVGVLATAYGEKDCTTRKVYDETLRMPFEDMEVNVPAGYKEYLDNLYGEDWMQLPDESRRVSHHNMEAFWL